MVCQVMWCVPLNVNLTKLADIHSLVELRDKRVTTPTRYRLQQARMAFNINERDPIDLCTVKVLLIFFRIGWLATWFIFRTVHKIHKIPTSEWFETIHNRIRNQEKFYQIHNSPWGLIPSNVFNIITKSIDLARAEQLMYIFRCNSILFILQLQAEDNKWFELVLL